MKIALEKGFVFRSAPTEKHIKKFDVSSHEFEDWKVLHYGTPKDGDPILYYLHGGGFVAGMFKNYYDNIGPLSKELGFPVIVPDYKMPEEVDAKVMQASIMAHFEQVRADYPNSKILVGGDSAGAHAALVLAQMLGAEAPQMIDALYLLYGWFDLTRQEADYPNNYEEVLLSAELTPQAANRFRGDIPADDPRISPIFGTIDQLPRVQMITGDKDMLFAESLMLDERLAAAGADYSHFVHKGYAHDFWLLPSPDGRRAMREMAAMMRGDAAVSS